MGLLAAMMLMIVPPGIRQSWAAAVENCTVATEADTLLNVDLQQTLFVYGLALLLRLLAMR
jgi:hypothetical protein